jgi:hypothetical protein
MEEKDYWKVKLAILDKRVRSFLEGYRQNVALLGDDREEISYLLENYFQENRNEELIHIHTVASYTSQREFFKSAAFSLLSDYLCRIDSLDNLINYASMPLAETVNLIKNTLKKSSISFLEILEVINKFINESKKRCIFILEEFLNMEKLFPSFLKDFSQFIILQRNCLVVITSSSSKEAEKVLSTKLNLLFGGFEKLFLNEVTFVQCYNYLKRYIEPLSTSPFFISLFIKIIGSNIIYYNLIGDSIKKKYCQEDEDKSIISILEDTLYSKDTYLFQKFINRVDLIQNSIKSPSGLKVLVAISEGYIRKEELVSLSLCSTKELTNRLQRLCELNCIESLGNIYKIKDTLFSFWLAYIFKLYYGLSVTGLQKRKVMWQKKMYETIALFKEEFFKDKINKVLELVLAFKDDVLRIEKVRYKLPFIKRTKIISYPEKFLHLIVGEGKEVVLVGVKEKNVDDDDIIEFIEKTSSIKRKGIRKIFISLERFSPSAKLIAKNNRLTIWDVNEVNFLSNIFNKSTIYIDR